VRPRGRGIRDTKFDVSATHRPCDRLIATRRRTGRAPALAKAACNNGGPDVAGTADIGLVQGVSGAASNGDFIDHLRITNYGPCNVPNVGLVAALPGNLVAFSSNPASWTCTGIGSLTATCSETSTIGVPGTADIYLEYVSTPGLITACAATFSTPLSLATCPNWNGAPPDPNPSNNGSTIAGAVLGANGTLTYGPNGQPDPSSINGFTHTTSVTLANGGIVNISQSGGCPLSVADCFIGTATINFTNVNGQKTWTLTFLASLTKKSLSQITIWNSVSGGGYTALTNCSGKHPTDPCVQSRSRSTNANGDTVYTIVVVGTQDNGMTAD